MNKILKSRIPDICRLCKELRVARIYAFGSCVSGNFSKESDLDFLIRFSDKLSVDDYTDNYFLLHYKLRELFDREVDITTERSLSNPFFVESVNKTRELLYEEWD